MKPGEEEMVEGEDVAWMMIAWSHNASAFCRRIAAAAVTPAVRERLLLMAESHQQHARELETLVRDEDARSEITHQINDLFLG
jgi:hypothetical protein